MEAGEPLRVVNEIFGYRKIVWNITNFLAASCAGDGCVWSPVFCVYSPFLTKWRFGLSPNQNDHHFIFVYVERLKHDPFPERVVVNCKVAFSGETLNEKTLTFDVGQVSRIFTSLSDNKCRILLEMVLSFECYFIVYREDDMNIFDFYAEGCLKSLSQDMCMLNSWGKDYDTELYTGSTDTMKVHRAILCCRNRVFREMMVLRARVVDLNYPHTELSSVKTVISFLYTGNLKHILRLPSFKIEKAINHFDVEELKPYYSYDELNLESSYPVREEQFEWVLHNLPVAESFVATSDIMRGLTDGLVFRLAIITGETGAAGDYVSLKIGLLENEQTIGFCMYFGIVDIHNVIHYLRFLRWFPGNIGEITIHDFFPRNILNHPLYVRGGDTRTMMLLIKMQRACDAVVKVVCESHPAIERIDKYKHYIKLSQQMSSLVDIGKYGDTTVESRILRFRLHKMILRSRSHVLNRILEKKSSVCLDKMEPDILHKTLQYMYTGVIRTNRFDKILKMYYQAHVLGVLALKNACSRALLGYLEVGNAIMILIKADSCKDSRLKSETVDFISRNLEEIRTKENWRVLQEEYPNLFENLFAFTLPNEDTAALPTNEPNEEVDE